MGEGFVGLIRPLDTTNFSYAAQIFFGEVHDEAEAKSVGEKKYGLASCKSRKAMWTFEEPRLDETKG